MHDLVDAWSIKRHFFVVGVTELYKGVIIVTTVLRLQSELATRRRKCLEKIKRRLFVTLRAIIDLEWGCAVHDKGCRNPRVAGTAQTLEKDACQNNGTHHS